MNSAPTQGLEPYKKEHLRFQRTNQMLHKSNARVYKLKNCGNQTLSKFFGKFMTKIAVSNAKKLQLHFLDQK